MVGIILIVVVLLQAKYLKEWQEETEIFKRTMEKFKLEHPTYFTNAANTKKPHEPRTPVMIFKDECVQEYMAKHPEVTRPTCAL